MAHDGVRVEADTGVTVLKMLLVTLDPANGVAHQRVETRSGDLRIPGMDVIDKYIDFFSFKFEVLEKVGGNLEESKSIEAVGSQT